MSRGVCGTGAGQPSCPQVKKAVAEQVRRLSLLQGTSLKDQPTMWDLATRLTVCADPYDDPGPPPQFRFGWQHVTIAELMATPGITEARLAGRPPSPADDPAPARAAPDAGPGGPYGAPRPAPPSRRRSTAAAPPGPMSPPSSAGGVRFADHGRRTLAQGPAGRLPRLAAPEAPGDRPAPPQEPHTPDALPSPRLSPGADAFDLSAIRRASRLVQLRVPFRGLAAPPAPHVAVAPPGAVAHSPRPPKARGPTQPPPTQPTPANSPRARPRRAPSAGARAPQPVPRPQA